MFSDVQRIREAIAIYKGYFEKLDIPGQDFQREKSPFFYEAYSHCHSMLAKMEKFLEEGQVEKATRWVGFIQGVLWCTGAFSLEELKTHNRPDTDESESGEKTQEEMSRRKAAIHLI